MKIPATITLLKVQQVVSGSTASSYTLLRNDSDGNATFIADYSLHRVNGVTAGNLSGSIDYHNMVYDPGTTRYRPYATYHSSSNGLMVMFMSGANDDITSISPRVWTDTNFFVSGSIGSKDSASVRGTSVFGGDLVVSGNLHMMDGQDIALDTSDKIYFNGLGGDQWISGNGAMLQIDGDNYVNLYADLNVLVYSGLQINASGLDFDFRCRSTNKDSALLVDGGTDQLAILSNGTTAADCYGLNAATDPIPADTAIFISGSIGSKDSATDKGTAIFGGDIVISGALHGGSPLQIGEYRNDLGTDVAVFVSGTMSSKNSATGGSSVFGGDVVISGSSYVEQNLHVTGTLTVSQPGVGQDVIFYGSDTFSVGLQWDPSVTEHGALKLGTSGHGVDFWAYGETNGKISSLGSIFR